MNDYGFIINDKKYLFSCVPTKHKDRYILRLYQVFETEKWSKTKNLKEFLLEILYNYNFEDDIIHEEIIAILPEEDFADYFLDIISKIEKKLRE